MREPTFKKFVAEQGTIMPNLWQIVQSFWSHSCVFALEKYPKNLNFQSFFTLKEALVATFNKTRVPTSRKYVAEQGIIMPNLLQALQSFWSHSSVFALENYPKNAKF